MSSPPLSPKADAVHILYVEDAAEDARLMQASFESLPDARGELHHVLSAEAAIRFLNKEAPFEQAPDVGLVLLDLMLPEMTGAHLLQELKTNPHTRAIPVVVLTGSEDPNDVEHSYVSHANAVIRKPGSLDELVDIVNALDEFWTRMVELPQRDPSA